MGVDAHGRLQQPGQRQRGDVLRTGRLQAAHRLAEVVGVLPSGEPSCRAHVALLEVAEIGAEGKRLDHGLPDIKERDRDAGPDDKQATETPVGQGR